MFPSIDDRRYILVYLITDVTDKSNLYVHSNIYSRNEEHDVIKVHESKMIGTYKNTDTQEYQDSNTSTHKVNFVNVIHYYF